MNILEEERNRHLYASGDKPQVGDIVVTWDGMDSCSGQRLVVVTDFCENTYGFIGRALKKDFLLRPHTCSSWYYIRKTALLQRAGQHKSWLDKSELEEIHKKSVVESLLAQAVIS